MSSTRLIVLPTCSICQDDEAGLEIVVTYCGHVFHGACIRQWDSNQRSRTHPTKCPCCNVELKRFPNSPSRFIRLHSLTERRVDNESSSQPSNQQAETRLQSELEQSKKKLLETKKISDRRATRIQELTLEPARLKREKEELNTEMRLLNQYNKILTDKSAQLDRELKQANHERRTQQTAHASETGRLKAELEKVSDKYSNLKNDRDQLKEQLTQKIDEIAELQSFIDEFSQEKTIFQVTESQLKTQLQELTRHVQTLKNANSIYNQKLKEAKKKISHVESRFGISVGDGSTPLVNVPVRRCLKFEPDKSSSLINVFVSNTQQSNSATPQFKRSLHDSPYRPAAETSENKRFRTTTRINLDGEESFQIQIQSDPDDSIEFIQPSRKRADPGNITLPSLFGNDSKSSFCPPSKSYPLAHPKTTTKSLARSTANQPSGSTIMDINKLLATGPKVKHR